MCYAGRKAFQRNPVNNKTFSELNLEWRDKRDYLIQQGYKVVYIWSCEWAAMLENDPALKQFVDGMEIGERVVPRKSFRGGRTENFVSYHLCEEGEECHYKDITSLYPFVLKYKGFYTFFTVIFNVNIPPFKAPSQRGAKRYVSPVKKPLINYCNAGKHPRNEITRFRKNKLNATLIKLNKL